MFDVVTLVLPFSIGWSTYPVAAPSHHVLGEGESPERRRRRRPPPPVAMTCAPVLNTEIGKSVDKEEVFVVVVIVIDCRTIL